MFISVKVVPNAKKFMVKEEREGLKVYLTQPPADGKANRALVEALAGYFGVKKARVSITKGLQSRVKTITIST